MVARGYGPVVALTAEQPSWPGAAPTGLARLLAGPVREARVVGVHPTCVYLLVGAQLVAVETADAVGLPCAVRLGVDAELRPFRAVRRETPALVGDARIAIGSMAVPVIRWWAPRRSRPGTDPTRIDALARALAAYPCAVPVDLPASDLLGLGPGLTPAGDDVLAGMLVATHRDPVVGAALAGSVLATAGAGTTALSAALLRLAAMGHGIPALLDLADVLAGHGPAAQLPATLSRLRAVGHTSGVALAWGLLRGARSVTCSPAIGEGVLA